MLSVSRPPPAPGSAPLPPEPPPGAGRTVGAISDWLFTTEPAALHAVKEGLESKRYKIDDAELAWVPKNTVKVEGDNAANLLKLLEALEELDDVQKVDANFEMDDDAMADA